MILPYQFIVVSFHWNCFLVFIVGKFLRFSLVNAMEEPNVNKEKRKKIEWETESYAKQSKEDWPGRFLIFFFVYLCLLLFRGQVILAQFSEEYVVVYQAYKKVIADYAVAHHKFDGCPSFGLERMVRVFVPDNIN